MAGGLVPQAIVLALGAGALGGPDALRHLLQFAGRSPASDLAICVAAISLLTAPFLGTILLARFVRKTRAGGGGGGGGAPATDLFAQVTATVSVGAAVLVTACHLVEPAGLDAIRLPIDFTVKNQIVVTVLAISAAATGSLPCAVPPRRFLRGAGGVGRAALAARARTIKVVVFLVAMSSLIASGGFDAHAQAQLLFPEFHWRMVTLPAGVAIVTVAGTMLLVRCSRRARSAAGAGGGVAALTR